MAEVRCSGVPAEAECRAKVAGGHRGQSLSGLPEGVLMDGSPAPLQVSPGTLCAVRRQSSVGSPAWLSCPFTSPDQPFLRGKVGRFPVQPAPLDSC